jgi:curved DNA-binding protein CbpA
MAPREQPFDGDPWAVLGVPPDADEEQVRAAYLARVKEHPPDRAGEQFERIRDAYHLLRDPHRRGQRRLLSADPRAKLISLLPEGVATRRYLGPGPWLAALNDKGAAK